MALSKQVQESLDEAQSNLRNALAFSARSEEPYVSKHIADLLSSVDNIIDATEMIEKIENRKPGDSGMFGTFFNREEDD